MPRPQWEISCLFFILTLIQGKFLAATTTPEILFDKCLLSNNVTIHDFDVETVQIFIEIAEKHFIFWTGQNFPKLIEKH